MSVLFGKQKNGTAAIFAPQFYTQATEHVLTVAGPMNLQRFSVSSVMRMSMTFTDAPAPRERTIVLGRSSPAIRA